MAPGPFALCVRWEGTLTPLIPLSLRAFKVEGERITEGRTYAVHTCGPLVQYWGGRGKGGTNRAER